MEAINDNNNKYTKAKIYKIVDNGYNLTYFGSTTKQLSTRMVRHIRMHRLHSDGKYHNVSVFKIFDEFGTENCRIELVENFSCNTKTELLKREGFYISNKECVNRYVAGRTQIRNIVMKIKKQSENIKL